MHLLPAACLYLLGPFENRSVGWLQLADRVSPVLWNFPFLSFINGTLVGVSATYDNGAKLTPRDCLCLL
jgi:hypothetical protein